MILTKIKNITVDFAKKQYGFFKKVLSGKGRNAENYKRTAIMAIFMTAVIILPIFPFSTLTLAYEVKYDNNSVGYVSNENDYKEVKTIIDDKLAGGIENSLELSTAIVTSNLLNTVNEVSQNLSDTLEKNESIVSAYGIYIEDKCIAANYDKSLLLNAIASYKSKVQAATKADEVDFDKAVSIKECLSLTERLTNLEDTIALVEQFVDCKVGFYKNQVKTEKHKTVTKKDSSLYKGIEKVKTKGSNGKQEIKSLIWYRGGKKVDNEIVKRKILKKSKTAVVLVGTKKRPKVDLKGKKYLWPLEKSASCYISSGFGMRNGRLHKGIDIISDYGTKILAAADGVVTRSSWFESYGYCVDIRHSDGTVTRYAHCSKLLVNVGEEVIMGQTIAKVGSTGRSTANHLHFEVRPNGADPVNPNKYVKK